MQVQVRGLLRTNNSSPPISEHPVEPEGKGISQSYYSQREDGEKKGSLTKLFHLTRITSVRSIFPSQSGRKKETLQEQKKTTQEQKEKPASCELLRVIHC